jgi:coiled-coil domain-containing protein 6
LNSTPTSCFVRNDLRRDKVRLGREKISLENTMEAEEEHIVNRLQSQLLEMYQRNRFLERRLEAGGSQTPSVVSESETSDDEIGAHARGRGGGSSHSAHHAGGSPHHGGNPGHGGGARGMGGLGGGSVGSSRGGAPHYGSHAPWEREMYASAFNGRRRKSGGSSVVSVATSATASTYQDSIGTSTTTRSERDGGSRGGGGKSGGGGGGGGGEKPGREEAADGASGLGVISISRASTPPASESVDATPISTPRSARSVEDGR